VVAAPKFRHDDKGKTVGICSEKKERNQMEGAAAKSHFPYSMWKTILSFMKTPDQPKKT
jgi:hypothetical protein